MENAQRIKVLEKNIERLLSWARAAETRIAFILPLSTAMFTALAVSVPGSSEWSVFQGIVTAFTIVFLFGTLGCAAFASFPKTNGTKGSLIYFGGISSMEKNQYKTAIMAMNENSYIEDLISQSHINAQIAYKKYFWIQKSLGCLFVATPFWIAAIYCLYQAKG